MIVSVSGVARVTATRLRRGSVAYLSSVEDLASTGVVAARGVRRSVGTGAVDTAGERRVVGLFDTEGQRPSSIETGGVRPREALRASVLRGTRA